MNGSNRFIDVYQKTSFKELERHTFTWWKKTKKINKSAFFVTRKRSEKENELKSKSRWCEKKKRLEPNSMKIWAKKVEREHRERKKKFKQNFNLKWKNRSKDFDYFFKLEFFWWLFSDEQKRRERKFWSSLKEFNVFSMK